MRVKTIALKNLGRHKSLKAKLDGPVIGLIGKNGSGKSTLIKVIHLLLTGATPTKETQESFIRRVDPSLEEQPDCGEAHMAFEASGQSCTLYRKIGKNASRKLQVGKTVYTSANEIQAKLADILGADKYAIDNAAFPAQGELDKILFGSQSEREELLVKLLLMGHMQKVADIAAAKIKTLGAEIQDFSVLHDELISSRRVAEEQLGIMTAKLNQASSYEVEINQYKEFSKLTENCKRCAETIRHKKEEIASLEVKVASTLADICKKLNIEASSKQDLIAWRDKLANKITEYRNNKQDVLNKGGMFTIYDGWATRRDTISEALDNETIIDKPDPTILPALNARRDAQVARQEAENKVNALTSALAAKTSELAENENSVVQLTGRREELSIKLQQIRTTRDMHRLVVDTCNLAMTSSTCAAQCPICASTMDHAQLKDRHAIYTKHFNESDAEHTKLNAEFNTLVQQLHINTRNSTRIQTDIALYSDAQTKANNVLLTTQPEDIAQLDKLIAQQSNLEAAANKSAGIIHQLEKDLQVADNVLSGYTPEVVASLNTYTKEYVQDRVAKIDIALTRWEPLIEEFRKSEADINTAETLIERAHKEVALNTEQEKEYTEALREAVANFSKRLASIMASTSEGVEEILRVKDMDYAELRIRTSQLLAQANAIKKRLLEIEQKIQLDAEKRDVIGELQRIVAAFSRSGIPMAYVQHKFDSLVTMTQENLEIMDANFAIIPHPERPVSLQFYRVDEPGQVLFDHEKLSGGQKVRLSVAFLLAVQQLVVPDLGFLVLDEPSTHLDEESRENLKDLLLNLGQQLENTDTQILVCDHAQELQPAFFNTIEL